MKSCVQTPVPPKKLATDKEGHYINDKEVILSRGYNYKYVRPQHQST
jgi:hypothetical protein